MRAYPLATLRLLSRYRREVRGAVALEFALLLLPFLMLIFAILEIALLFLMSASLDTSMETAARQIRTGAFESKYSNASDAIRRTEFENLVCSQVTWLVNDCRTKLTIDIRTLTDWTSSGYQDGPYDPDEDEFDETKTSVAKTEPEKIVLVRAWYRWPLLTPFLSQSVSRLGGGVALLSSTQAFRTEPYGAGTPAPTPPTP
jgi:Flp pilus assembly protein TadG